MTANRMEPPAHPYGPPHDEGVKAHQGHDHGAANPPIDHEISSRGVVVFTAWMGAITLAALVLMWLLLRGFLRSEVRADPKPGPLAAQIAARVEQGPPDPKLQRTPTLDMTAMRAHETERLRSYGWVDQGQQTAHIPIGRAMEIVARGNQ